jgi:preprotein translocase subunit SecA
MHGWVGEQRAEDLVLRDFNFCVIDEVDSILIDEARTPLIISGPAEKSSYKYQQAAQLAEAMERDLHYTVDEKQKSILITEEGYEAAEDVLQVWSSTSLPMSLPPSSPYCR